MSSDMPSDSLRHTVLRDRHLQAGARLVDFAGWDMPVHYGSQVEEHHAVRRDAGVFDVGHMRVLDVEGDGALAFLRGMLANDAARLVPGRALYSCMLDPDGGVMDDLIVYRRADKAYRIVLNAATALADLEWLRAAAPAQGVTLTLREDLSILAVQGPTAIEGLRPLLPDALRESVPALKAFGCAEAGDWFVGRTGYTGEDGVELVIPAATTPDTWDRLLEAGIRPCGLGARDTLRLEAGMNLYGQDMDRGVTPMECGLAWTVHLTDESRDFVGRRALADRPVRYRQTGVLLEGRGVLRGHMKLRFADGGEGETTSGSYAPTLARSIGLARVDAGAAGAAEVEIRGQWHPVRLLRPPFARNGASLVTD